eukprot:Lankesteria_metandrocarpae@DN2111_c0_g1_i1.p1
MGSGSLVFGGVLLVLSAVEIGFSTCVGLWWPYSTFKKSLFNVTLDDGSVFEYPGDMWSRTNAALCFSAAVIMSVVLLVGGLTLIVLKGRKEPLMGGGALTFFSIGVGIASIVTLSKVRNHTQSPTTCTAEILKEIKCGTAACSNWAIGYCKDQDSLTVDTIIYQSVSLTTRIASAALMGIATKAGD